MHLVCTLLILNMSRVGQTLSRVSSGVFFRGTPKKKDPGNCHGLPELKSSDIWKDASLALQIFVSFPQVLRNCFFSRGHPSRDVIFLGQNSMCFFNRVQQTVSGNAPQQHPPDTINWTLFRCPLRG